MSTRRDFFKSACMSGICLCGFSSLAQGKVMNALDALEGAPDNEGGKMFLRWITEVLGNLDANLPKDEIRKIVKSASIADHISLGMDEVLAPYKGKLDEFVKFLEKEWGWKISFEDNKRVIIADEDKPVCVCPLVRNAEGRKFPALCYCSEGFAERMFSVACAKQVHATVVSSIQWGDERCVYRIEVPEGAETKNITNPLN